MLKRCQQTSNMPLLLLLLLLSLLGRISMGNHMVTSAFCPKSNNFQRPLGAGN